MARNEVLNKIKAFGMTNEILTEDLHRIGVAYSVDLGHAPITTKVEDVYYPQFDAKLREEAAAMARHCEVFYCLEKAIRILVSETIETAERTEDWWPTQRVPQDIKTEVAVRIQKELDAGVNPPIDGRVGLHDLWRVVWHHHGKLGCFW
jgi:hypothetical protein